VLKAASLTGTLLRKPKSAARQARSMAPVTAAAPQARPTLATLAPRPLSEPENGEVGALLRKPTLAAPTVPAKPARTVRLASSEAPLRPTITALPLRLTPPAGNDGVTRVSLRINSARHRRLRIAAAHLGLTNSRMMVTAINHYLDHVVPKLVVSESAGAEQGGEPTAANLAARGVGGAKPSRTP